MQYLRNIANIMKISGCDVPEWMLKIRKSNKLKEKHAIKRPHISTKAKEDLIKSRRKQYFYIIYFKI